MPLWKTTIRPGGKPPGVEATVEAKSQSDAKKLFEAQYGKAAVKFGISQVR